MIDLFRDPIWTFVSSIIALAAVLVSIYLYLLQKRKKSLCYQILTETDLLTIDEEIKGRIKILFDEAPIQNASLIILKITNDGNLPIASTDFERPLTFSLSNSSIISAEIIRKSPSTLKPELYTQASQVKLEPLLLNSKDSITIKLLVTQYDQIIEPDTRIIGVTEVKKVEFKPVRIGIVQLVVLAVPFVLIITSVIQTLERAGISRLQSILMTIPFFTMVLFLIMLYTRNYRGRA